MKVIQRSVLNENNKPTYWEKGKNDMSKNPFNTQENNSRVFICEECNVVFTDKEIRKDMQGDKWGHVCKAKKYKKECRCESYLKAFLPE